MIRFDHVGITVRDLPSAVAFFTELGLVVEGSSTVAGEFIDVVTGIPDAHTEIVMLHEADGAASIELSSFRHPEAVDGSAHALANEVGLRSVAFEVDDLDALLRRLEALGYGLIGGVGEYERVWRMAYVRGPEGITVALAQRLG